MAETVQESEAESRKRIFEELPVPQALKVMVVPTIISQIIVLIYNMADTFYVGRTNDPYMVAGVSLILPVFNILICLAGLAGTGGGTLISRLLGEGKETEARRVSWFSIYISIGMALFYSAIMGLFMDPILKALGASDTIFSYARQYVFCVIVLGACRRFSPMCCPIWCAAPGCPERPAWGSRRPLARFCLIGIM